MNVQSCAIKEQQMNLQGAPRVPFSALILDYCLLNHRSHFEGHDLADKMKVRIGIHFTLLLELSQRQNTEFADFTLKKLTQISPKLYL